MAIYIWIFIRTRILLFNLQKCDFSCRMLIYWPIASISCFLFLPFFFPTIVTFVFRFLPRVLFFRWKRSSFLSGPTRIIINSGLPMLFPVRIFHKQHDKLLLNYAYLPDLPLISPCMFLFNTTPCISSNNYGVPGNFHEWTMYLMVFILADLAYNPTLVFLENTWNIW